MNTQNNPHDPHDPHDAEAVLAEEYNTTRDLSGFDFDHPEPVTVRRSVVISVRFSEDEIKKLRNIADSSDTKVTAYIRDAALNAAAPVDRAALSKAAADLERQAHELAGLVGQP